MDQAVHIPHLPQRSAYESGQSGKYHGIPIAVGQGRQDGGVPSDDLYPEHGEEGGYPEERKQQGGPEPNHEKPKTTQAAQQPSGVRGSNRWDTKPVLKRGLHLCK